jgi:DHA2 family multidrug resistance protein
VPATETLSQLTQRFGGSDGQLKALKQMSLMVRQQAAVMSFADVFLMLTVLFFAIAALGIIMKKPVPVAAGAGGH